MLPQITYLELKPCSFFFEMVFQHFEIVKISMGKKPFREECIESFHILETKDCKKLKFGEVGLKI